MEVSRAENDERPAKDTDDAAKPLVRDVVHPETGSAGHSDGQSRLGVKLLAQRLAELAQNDKHVLVHLDQELLDALHRALLGRNWTHSRLVHSALCQNAGHFTVNKVVDFGVAGRK